MTTTTTTNTVNHSPTSSHHSFRLFEQTQQQQEEEQSKQQEVQQDKQEEQVQQEIPPKVFYIGRKQEDEDEEKNNVPLYSQRKEKHVPVLIENRYNAITQTYEPLVDYDRLDDRSRKMYVAEFNSKFNLFHKKLGFHLYQVDENSDLFIAHQELNRMRRIEAGRRAQKKYRNWLRNLSIGIEVLVGMIFPSLQIKGFSSAFCQTLGDYDDLLIELGEKHAFDMDEDLSPETQIILMVGVNLAGFLLLKRNQEKENEAEKINLSQINSTLQTLAGINKKSNGTTKETGVDPTSKSNNSGYYLVR